MCGYCTEVIAYDVAAAEKRGALPPIDLFAGATQHLQSTNDLHATLERIKAVAHSKDVAAINLVDDEAIICRAIDILVLKGFDSAEYQQLLRNTLFRKAIFRSCSRKRRQQAERLASAGAFGGLIDLLYRTETFTTSGGAQHLSLGSLLDDCTKAGEWYVAWWLDDETERDAEIDPEENWRFRCIFRALFFSVILLGRQSKGKALLLRVVTTLPARCPNFDALDLWLQRHAALCLFDVYGIGPFLEELHHIRDSLIYHLDLKRVLTAAQKTALLDVVRSRPEAAATDDYFSLSEWL